MKISVDDVKGLTAIELSDRRFNDGLTTFDEFTVGARDDTLGAC